jgi:hypothetical protein
VDVAAAVDDAGRELRPADVEREHGRVGEAGGCADAHRRCVRGRH